MLEIISYKDMDSISVWHLYLVLFFFGLELIVYNGIK